MHQEQQAVERFTKPNPSLAERLEAGMVTMASIASPYYAYFDDPREAERWSANPVWDWEEGAYRFSDGSYGRFVQVTDDTGALVWELSVGSGIEASKPLPRMKFVALPRDAE